MGGENRNGFQQFAWPVLSAALLCVAVLAVTQAAQAQTRRQPDTVHMTCEQTHDLITRFGAINLKSGPMKFDRYVAGRKDCFSHRQVLRTTHVRTSDTSRCSVQLCVDQNLTQDR